MTDKATVIYRRKMDGSFDSICLNCLGTIQRQEETTDAELDAIHRCAPLVAARHPGASEFAA